MQVLAFEHGAVRVFVVVPGVLVLQAIFLSSSEWHALRDFCGAARGCGLDRSDINAEHMDHLFAGTFGHFEHSTGPIVVSLVF